MRPTPLTALALTVATLAGVACTGTDQVDPAPSETATAVAVPADAEDTTVPEQLPDPSEDREPAPDQPTEPDGPTVSEGDLLDDVPASVDLTLTADGTIFTAPAEGFRPTAEAGPCPFGAAPGVELRDCVAVGQPGERTGVAWAAAEGEHWLEALVEADGAWAVSAMTPFYPQEVTPEVPQSVVLRPVRAVGTGIQVDVVWGGSGAVAHTEILDGVAGRPVAVTDRAPALQTWTLGGQVLTVYEGPEGFRVVDLVDGETFVGTRQTLPIGRRTDEEVALRYLDALHRGDPAAAAEFAVADLVPAEGSELALAADFLGCLDGSCSLLIGDAVLYRLGDVDGTRKVVAVAYSGE